MSRKLRSKSESDRDEYDEAPSDTDSDLSVGELPEDYDSPDEETKSFTYDQWLREFLAEMETEFIKNFGDEAMYGTFEATLMNLMETLASWEKVNPMPK
jgi:hypothetical protein